MALEQDWSLSQVAVVIGGVGAIALIPGVFLLSAHAQTTYSDVTPDYWAQPFIQELSEADILTGYPDGTYRPEQAMDRDEYAAVIRQAFEAKSVRSFPQASTFEDVPENYWANAAIAEAYETGFMGTPDPNEFEPQTEISRADAIVALVEGLGIKEEAAAPVAAVPAAAETVQPVQPAQANQQRRKAPNRLTFPMASTALMQVFAPPVQATTVTNPIPPAAQVNGTNPDTGATVGIDLSEYYADADQIPDYAVDEIAAATQTGLIVNYPDRTVLNPNEPITRGGVAALIHQALVYQNELEPLPDSSIAREYIAVP
ncbi:MAG: S-layer homology domain-containing protein [Cyanobacteria bacterium J06626_18]